MTKISPLFKDSRVWDYLRLNSFRSERHKLFYVATPKVACTSLKWWFAELEGCSQVLRGTTDSAETDPDLVIHDTFHKVAPNVTGLMPEALSEALTSDSYFRFAVVRNPYTRIFSAWQSKLLLREPLQIEPYLQCDFFHRPIECATDIAAAFEGFLEHLAANDAPSFWDIHWTPQAVLLRPDLINYSKLVKIENAKELSQSLRAQLGVHIPDPFATRRTNESLIPYLPEFVTERTSELIRSLYAEDFEVFRYNKQPPKAKETVSADQFALALRAITLIRGRHQRFSEVRSSLSGQITSLDQAVTERNGQIANLNQAVTKRDGQIATLNQAITERDGQIAAYQRQAEQFDKQLKATQDELRAAYAQIKTQSSDLTAYQRQAEQFDKQLKAIQDELRAAYAQIKTQSLDLTAYQRQAEEFNQRVEAAQAELRAAYAQMETQRTDVAAYQRQAEQFDKQLKATQDELRAAYAQIKTQSSDLTAYQRQAEQFDKQLKAIQDELRAAYAQIKTQSSDLTAYQRKAEQFDRQLEDTQSRLQDLAHLRQAELQNPYFLARQFLRALFRRLRLRA